MDTNGAMPRITVVVAVFNAASTLQRCFDSISCQSCGGLEVIVMDGGSTDGSVEIIKANSSLLSYWESAPDRGIYHAWNKALCFATGDWIYFLGADDVLHDVDVLQRFRLAAQSIATPPLVAYGKVAYCEGSRRTLLGQEWRITKNRMRCEMSVPHQGVFHHKQLFERCGKFDERFQVAGDYLLLLKSLRYGDPLFLGDFVIADQYAGGKSSERANRWMVVEEFRLAQKEVGISWSFCWFWSYVKARVWRCLF